MALVSTVQLHLPRGLGAPNAADVSVDYRSGCLYICCTKQRCILRARPQQLPGIDSYTVELFAGVLSSDVQDGEKVNADVDADAVGGQANAPLGQALAILHSSAQEYASDDSIISVQPSIPALKRSAAMLGAGRTDHHSTADGEVHIRKFSFSYPHQVAYHANSGMLLVLDGQAQSLLRIIHHGTVRGLPTPHKPLHAATANQRANKRAALALAAIGHAPSYQPDLQEVLDMADDEAGKQSLLRHRAGSLSSTAPHTCIHACTLSCMFCKRWCTLHGFTLSSALGLSIMTYAIIAPCASMQP